KGRGFRLTDRGQQLEKICVAEGVEGTDTGVIGVWAVGVFADSQAAENDSSAEVEGEDRIRIGQTAHVAHSAQKPRRGIIDVRRDAAVTVLYGEVLGEVGHEVSTGA